MTATLGRMLAKSSPKELLTGHLAATLAGAGALEERVGRIAVAEQVTGAIFWTAVRLAALCHDAGKVPDGFQAMLAGRIRSWGERHEVVSLGFLPRLIAEGPLLTWVATGVVTHHRSFEGGRGPLTPFYAVPVEEWRERLHPIPPEAVAELTTWLAGTAASAGLPVLPASSGAGDLVEASWQVFHHLLDTWELPVDPDTGLTAVLLQGAVTLADHVSSAHGRLDTRQPLGAGFRSLLEKKFTDQGRALYPHQARAAEVDGHLLLRAPTGSGKTESGLLWAASQVVTTAGRVGGVPRVFFTLPYLASINAMAGRLGRLLGDESAVGVMHSRAGSYHLSTAICPQDGDEAEATAARKAASRAAATRLFQETLRVGTPYQILRGALAGPAHAGILVDAANSVFVLDELHAYDPRRLGYILATARLWERLGGRIAVLSATLPDALTALFRDTLHGDVQLVEADTTDSRRRHRLRLRDRHLTDPATIEEIGRSLDAGRAVLVVANNVADAQHLYAELTQGSGREPEDAYLLHSRFRRMDRAALEQAITERFGVDRPRRGGLVVATQVVEVSLDVDFDVLFTSAAPLEALLQRFGRVNRIAARPPADVIVHPAAFAPRKGGGPEHADGVYLGAPVEITWRILGRHEGADVDEGEARTWLDEVYDSTWGHDWYAEVTRSRVTFEDAFLRFAHPFVARDDLAQLFDKLFDGTEAVLEQDRDAYQAALRQVDGSAAAGRLLAERYLVPMPHWTTPLTTWEKRIGARIVNADYDERLGLGQVHGPAAQRYEAGEVL
ncbi:CRISPR-associated helicase/endonuclease Cas3 [Sphaerisporangium rufum]|uniref:CRISPR-associated helicase/endonuclease Cas3 n=1 Tax=Sphaerisporangium rufum TaxID=1381558 RepID=A0A919UYA3_9ACTN|nr:CRISPR-associated helicase Cas3' [Sphaerisporangium rufum]GII76649.1 CRISPR-associated helicase/endonuclease Cas3 [Sphaerisporangium rufum]